MNLTEDSGKARAIIGVLLLVLIICLNAALLFHPPVDDFTKTQFNVLNGALLAQMVVMMSFYFGTSSGAKTLSAAQNDTTKAFVASATGGNVATLLGDGKAPTGKADDPVAVTEVPPKGGNVASPTDPETGNVASPDGITINMSDAKKRVTVDVTTTPEYQSFRQRMLGMNHNLDDATIRRTWDAWHPDVDVNLT